MIMPPQPKTPTVTHSLNPPNLAGTSGMYRLVTLVAALTTLAGILLVHPMSIFFLLNYVVFWYGFIFFFHRQEMADFALSFSVNSAFIAIFFIVQTSVYPESYGTTSPLGSWTDDSFFFSLVADTIPQGLETRADFILYDSPFSTMIRWVTVLPVHHPMEVIFFQSGTAALLSTFTKRALLQAGADPRTAQISFILAMISPFLMMNGGVILLRDTLAAALFIYSLCCINARLFPFAFSALLIQVLIRPGTAALLLPLYFIIYMPHQRRLDVRNFVAIALGLPILLLTTAALALSFIDQAALELYLGSTGLTGREVFDDLKADSSANQIFLAIQEMPFLGKFILNGAYIFLYPFFSPNSFSSLPFFDLRMLSMGIVIPIAAFWLNAWFIAGAITRTKIIQRQRNLAAAFIVGCLLIGTYSLQTRHKTILYPLYFAVAAIGVSRAEKLERGIGYGVAGGLLAAQLVVVFR